MPDITQCPECQRKLNVREEHIGQTAQCPACDPSIGNVTYRHPFHVIGSPSGWNVCPVESTNLTRG